MSKTQTTTVPPSGPISQSSGAMLPTKTAPDPPGTIPVEEKLYLAKYKLDERPHLVIIDQNVCQKCAKINGTPQPCMIVCPANVYKWEDDKKNVVSYDNCVECGACRIICPYVNIEWKYPRWGRGLSHRYG